MGVLGDDPEPPPAVAGLLVAVGGGLQVAAGLGHGRPGRGQAALVAGGRGVGAGQEPLDRLGLAGGQADPRRDRQGVGAVAAGAVAGRQLELGDQPDGGAEVPGGLLDAGGDGEGVGDDLGVADVAGPGEEPALELGRLADRAPAGQDVGLAGGQADPS